MPSATKRAAAASILVRILKTPSKPEGSDIDDRALILALRRGKRAALEQAIARYSAYVAAVIAAQLGSGALREDVEELSSDVFFALWQSREKLKTDHLRGYLAAIARNAAKGFLRKRGPVLCPAEDWLCVQDADAPRLLEQCERRQLVEQLLGELDGCDREIFLRYYYYGQSTARISAQMQLNDNTVRSHLLRGRKKLRSILQQGGYSIEDQDF